MQEYTETGEDCITASQAVARDREGEHKQKDIKKKNDEEKMTEDKRTKPSKEEQENKIDKRGEREGLENNKTISERSLTALLSLTKLCSGPVEIQFVPLPPTASSPGKTEGGGPETVARYLAFDPVQARDHCRADIGSPLRSAVKQ